LLLFSGLSHSGLARFGFGVSLASSKLLEGGFFPSFVSFSFYAAGSDSSWLWLGHGFVISGLRVPVLLFATSNLFLRGVKRTYLIISAIHRVSCDSALDSTAHSQYRRSRTHSCTPRANDVPGGLAFPSHPVAQSFFTFEGGIWTFGAILVFSILTAASWVLRASPPPKVVEVCFWSPACVADVLFPFAFTLRPFPPLPLAFLSKRYLVQGVWVVHSDSPPTVLRWRFFLPSPLFQALSWSLSPISPLRQLSSVNPRSLRSPYSPFFFRLLGLQERPLSPHYLGRLDWSVVANTPNGRKSAILPLQAFYLLSQDALLKKKQSVSPFS